MSKKRVFSLLLCLLLLFSFFPLSAFADNRDLIVYYAVGSKSAYCYHARATCPSLSRSTVGEITLEEAASRGLSPCSRCHPPAPDFDVSATPKPTVTPGPSRSPKPTASSSPSLPVSSAQSRSSSDKSSGFTVTGEFIEIIVWALFGLGVSIYWLKGKLEDRKVQKNRAAEEKKRQNERETPKYVCNNARQEAPISPGPAKVECILYRDPAEELTSEPLPSDYEKESLEPENAPSVSLKPDNCFIGEDGLPACKDGPERWGDGYTFYMTASGRMYHTRYCKVGLRSPFHAVNAYDAKTGYRYYDGPHYYKPCSYCNPVLPDLSWYEEYQKLKKP